MRYTRGRMNTEPRWTGRSDTPQELFVYAVAFIGGIIGLVLQNGFAAIVVYALAFGGYTLAPRIKERFGL